MSVRRWGPNTYAAYVDDGGPFGRFVGTASSIEDAERLLVRPRFANSPTPSPGALMAEVTATNPTSLANLWQRADDLAAAIVRVRMLHRRADSWSGCVECSETHPCRTIRALDGEVLADGD